MIHLLLAAALTFSHITTPFSGTNHETFESQGLVNGQPCVTGRIFGNTADLCTNNATGSHVGTAVSGTCTATPHGGSYLFFTALNGAQSQTTTITFDTPVEKFGGYFTNRYSGWPHCNFGVEFWSGDGTYLGSDTIWGSPCGCTWQWDGWDFTAGPSMSIAVISGWVSNPAEMIAMDDLEATYSTQPGIDTCFPGIGSNASCPCGNPPLSLGRGCEHDTHNSGIMTSAGVASLTADTVVFSAADVPSSVSIGLYAGSPMAGAQFGSGVKCYSGSLGYLYAGNTGGGSYSAPTGAQASVSARHAALGDTLSSGMVRMYQFLYRQKATIHPCGAGTDYNFTQGQQITWGP